MTALNVAIDGEGPDLLMLHGGGGSNEDLSALRALLGPGRRIIAPDQRGHGRSPGDGEISYAAQAVETAALLDELGIRSADVVGFSDGGIVGLLLARDRPDLVGHLVAISANAALGSVPPAVEDRVTKWIASAKPSDLEMPGARAALADAERSWPETAAKILAMWRHGPDLELADLVRIGSKVLYIASDGDIVPPEHTVAMYRATPGATLSILPGADHQAVIKRPGEVAAIVEAFLGG